MILRTSPSFGTTYLGNPCTQIVTNLTFLETTITEVHFAADSMCQSSFKCFWWTP